MSNVVDINTGETLLTEQVTRDQCMMAMGTIQGYLWRIGNVHKEAYDALNLIAQYIVELERIRETG